MKKEPKIIDRKTAMQKGLNRYYTGWPCLRGHYALRATSTGTCQACHKEDRQGKFKEKRLAYSRAYHRRTRAEYAAARDARDLTSEGR